MAGVQALPVALIPLEEKLYSTLSPGERVAVLLAMLHATKPGCALMCALRHFLFSPLKLSLPN